MIYKKENIDSKKLEISGSLPGVITITSKGNLCKNGNKK